MKIETPPMLGTETPETGGRVGERIRIALVSEYTAGHVGFADTLHAIARSREDVEAELIRLPFESREPWERLPGVRGNWSARASLRARRELSGAPERFDVVLAHTQTVALACTRLMRQVPFVVSTDATPINFDEIGRPHGHVPGPAAAESLKRALVGRAYRSAAAVAAWSEWTRGSLLSDYRVPADRIVLIPAGVRLPAAVTRTDHDGPVRLLYVARHFEAKGGEDLLAALAPLPGWHLDVVTHSERTSTDTMTVHRGLTPSSPELAALYAGADLVVLPTRGDCSPFAILEGMAAGLPVITTPLGAISELVTADTGRLVAPGDVPGLRTAIAELLSSPERRRAMGAAGRARVEADYDAARQAARLIDLVREVGSRTRHVAAR